MSSNFVSTVQAQEVTKIGIVLDIGIFATDLILTNREAFVLEDVELDITITTQYDSVNLEFKKSETDWQPKDKIMVKNFAVYDYKKVTVKGTATVDGKPVKIFAEKKYKD
jgi:hypothetical protein